MKHLFNNEEEAIDIVIKSSKAHAEATDAGDYKIANKNYDHINDGIIYLLENNGVPELRKLLSHDVVSVKVWVASYLIKQDDPQAIFVLEEIASQSIPHQSFDAKIVLQEWQKGKLNL